MGLERRGTNRAAVLDWKESRRRLASVRANGERSDAVARLTTNRRSGPFPLGRRPGRIAVTCRLLVDLGRHSG